MDSIVWKTQVADNNAHNRKEKLNVEKKEERKKWDEKDVYENTFDNNIKSQRTRRNGEKKQNSKRIWCFTDYGN